MHIESQDFLDRSAELVYPLVRDRMIELLPFLPNVEQVSQVSSKQLAPGEWEIVNRWQGKNTLPAMAAKILPADLFHWMDYAHWFDDRHEVSYRIEGFGFSGRGVNSFKPEGNGTRIRITADIDIDPAKFKIPKLVFNKIFPLVEESIKKALEPNITALAKALHGYFDAQRGGN